jgi:hypothetical protein
MSIRPGETCLYLNRWGWPGSPDQVVEAGVAARTHPRHTAQRSRPRHAHANRAPTRPPTFGLLASGPRRGARSARPVRAPAHMPAVAVRAQVHRQPGPGFEVPFIGDAECVAAGGKTGLRLAVSSPVRRVQGELAMGWTLPRHATSLACRCDPRTTLAKKVLSLRYSVPRTGPVALTPASALEWPGTPGSTRR